MLCNIKVIGSNIKGTNMPIGLIFCTRMSAILGTLQIRSIGKHSCLYLAKLHNHGDVILNSNGPVIEH